jgi:flagellar biosynthesis protein FlhB
MTKSYLALIFSTLALILALAGESNISLMFVIIALMFASSSTTYVSKYKKMQMKRDEIWENYKKNRV